MTHVRAVITWIVCLFSLCSVAAAQGEMQTMKEKKLASEFLKKARWFTDYDKAKEEAKSSGKPIFVYFTRSYVH